MFHKQSWLLQFSSVSSSDNFTHIPWRRSIGNKAKFNSTATQPALTKLKTTQPVHTTNRQRLDHTRPAGRLAPTLPTTQPRPHNCFLSKKIIRIRYLTISHALTHLWSVVFNIQHFIHYSSTTIANMGARRIFSKGGQIRGLGTKVLQQGPGIEPKWRSGALWAQSLQKLTTGCEINAQIIRPLSILL